VDCDSLAEAAQRLKPDVIVLDLSLPNGHGLKVCRQLMKDNPGMRFIVFTAADDADVRQRALEAGASAFVHKLVVDGDLLSAVRRIATDS
jgi:DNA-binding NarL/FixJ family response regulator